MALLGYSSAPGWDAPENTVDVTGVGYAGQFDFPPQRREPVITGRVKLTNSETVRNLIRAALRYDTTLTSARANCLPLIAIRTGYGAPCGGTVNRVDGRYGLIEQLQITWAQQQMVEVTFQAQMLTLETSSASLTMPTPAAIIAAGGTPYSWHDARFQLKTAGSNSGGLDNVLNQATLTISNVITREGTREDFGDADPRSRIAYYMRAGGQSIRFSTNTQNIPDYCDAVTISNGKRVSGALLAGNTILALTGMRRDRGSQDEVQAEGVFAYQNEYKVSAAAVSASA